ncbi:MAG: nucleotidyltransferase family protein [Faecousia sp.]
MKIVGIICEYNPFHTGHARQIRLIRESFGTDCAIVCLMSGNFVQRGAPAIFDKSLRARAALESGADLVLELPITRALSSAEGFAAGGVEILGKFCDALCFGAETADADALMDTAALLLRDGFREALREALDTGLSFPAARQRALERLGGNGELVSLPNNILAVEYCKAILRSGCAMVPFPIHREGDYHAQVPEIGNPSAASLRNLIGQHRDISPYLPDSAGEIFRDAVIHTLSAGEKAVLYRLRTMTEPEFAALPYGSEGLWRKFMHASREQTSVEGILTAVKSKRYTRSRLDRMLMCAVLGITEARMTVPVPYTRVLGFREGGKAVLRLARETGTFLHAGVPAQDAYWELEQRCGNLYGLFADVPEAPGTEKRRRMIL